jgi:hypothetical protein
MNIKSVCLAVIAAAAFACSAARSVAAEPPNEDVALVSKLINATEKSDYKAFIALSAAPLKKESFDEVAAKLAPRLQAGHELLYLGTLNQGGSRVVLSKISFKGGGDDVLVTLSVKDGKVVRFLLR